MINKVYFSSVLGSIFTKTGHDCLIMKFNNQGAEIAAAKLEVSYIKRVVYNRKQRVSSIHAAFLADVGANCAVQRDWWVETIII